MSHATLSSTNAQRVETMQNALRELLRESLQRGFHGNATLEFSIQDGTIQWVRRRIERLER